MWLERPYTKSVVSSLVGLTRPADEPRIREPLLTTGDLLLTTAAVPFFEKA